MMAVRALAVLLALLLAGCAAAEDNLPEPRGGRSGLQLTGRLDGRAITVTDGLPELVFDCDLGDGPDDDLCIVSEDISGEQVIVAIENPAALEAGATLPIADVACADAEQCDAVAGAAIVELRLGTADRLPVVDGTLTVTAVERSRWAGTLELRLADGSLSGRFDVVPRPE